MTRRTLFALPAAALAATTFKKQSSPRITGWLTIAHGAWNKNNRAYSDAALRAMAAQCRGALVGHAKDHDGLSLDEIQGVAVESRIFSGDTVQVRVRWLSEADIPAGKLLSPWGVGTCTPHPDQPAFGTVKEDYRLEHLQVDGYSTFERAMRIT